MLRSTLPSVQASVLALVLLAGTTACGGDDAPAGSPQTSQTPQPLVSLGPVGGVEVTPTDGPTSVAPSPAATGAVPGLPADYPGEEVPVIRGVVTAQSGGTSTEGRRGWVLEMSAAGSGKSCLADAVAALVAEGFVKTGELVAGDTTQVQYVSDEYAVIISARDDGDELCQVGYEVGQVGK